MTTNSRSCKRPFECFFAPSNSFSSRGTASFVCDCRPQFWYYEIWPLMTSAEAIFDHSKKKLNTCEIHSHRLSKAVFRFSLCRLVLEISGWDWLICPSGCSGFAQTPAVRGFKWLVSERSTGASFVLEIQKKKTDGIRSHPCKYTYHKYHIYVRDFNKPSPISGIVSIYICDFNIPIHNYQTHCTLLRVACDKHALRRATKLALLSCELSYEASFLLLNLLSLYYRRRRGDN